MQVSDFLAYNADDVREVISNGRTFDRLTVWFGPYVAGEQFTMADCCAFANLPLNPPANDRPFSATFPFLAPPQGTPPLAATTGTAFDFRTDPESAYVVVDRMGMPAIATALIGSSQKNAYNDVTPTQDVAGQFRTEETNLLTGLYNNIADDLTRLGLRLCGRPA